MGFTEDNFASLPQEVEKNVSKEIIQTEETVTLPKDDFETFFEESESNVSQEIEAKKDSRLEQNDLPTAANSNVNIHTNENNEDNSNKDCIDKVHDDNVNALDKLK